MSYETVQFIEGVNEGEEPYIGESLNIALFSVLAIEYKPTLSNSIDKFDLYLVTDGTTSENTFSVSIHTDYKGNPLSIALAEWVLRTFFIDKEMHKRVHCWQEATINKKVVLYSVRKY